MTELLYSLYRFFQRNRLFFILLLSVVIGGAAFFGLKLKLKEDISEMIPKDEKIQKMNRVLQNSKFADKLIINIFLSDTMAPAAPDLLVRFSDTLSAVLASRLQPSYIKDMRVTVSDDLLNQIYGTIYNNLPVFLTADDYLRLDSLFDPVNLDKRLERNYKLLVSPAGTVIKKFVVSDPLGLSGNVMKKLQKLQLEENYQLYENHILTKDKKNLLFFITPTYPVNETGQNATLIHGMEEVIAEVSAAFDHKIQAEYFGAAAMSAGNAERIKSDISVTVTLAVSVLVIFMGLFFRRAGVVIIIFLPVAIGGVISLAALYFLKHEVSAIALGMGSVLLGITVDYSLHIFTHFRSSNSVRSIFRDLPLPLLLSCLITAGSFLCLIFVKSDALNDLGLFAAISVVNALLVALTVLPQFLKPSDHKHTSALAGLGFIDKYTAYGFDRNPVVIILIVAITVVSFFTASRVQFETDMMKMNYVSEKLYKAEKNLYKISNFALKSIYVVASGSTLSEALKANESVREQVDRLVEKGWVKNYSSVADFLISDSLQKERIKIWSDYWTPEKKTKMKNMLLEEGSKYRFSEKAFLPFFNLLDKTYTPVTTADFGEMKTLLFDDFVSEKPGFTTVVTLLKANGKDKEKILSAFQESENSTLIDRKYLTDRFVELMRDDFNTLEVLSLGLVFIVLVLCYGRLELGVIAFFPMAISWLWTLGIMGMLGIKFNIINIIISTFILGLGIDYSIFIMSGLIEEYKTGVDHLSSFKTSIFLSAFTSITGIGALIFAEHPALKSIAFLSIIGMASVITISYTLQPLLFRLLITRRTRKGFHPYTAYSLFITAFAYTYFLFGCLVLTITANLVLPWIPLRQSTKKRFFRFLLSKFCWSQIYIMGNVKKRILNPSGEDFSKPAIIIANHQSFLDILLTIMLSPNIILVTNDWVWNSPFFGRVVRYAGFFPASKGMGNGIDELQARIEEGLSVVIFPEGTRSPEGRIGRFHKGAFLLAEKLKVDLLPILIHGAGETITKNDLLLKDGSLTLKFLPRIAPSDEKFGKTYQERAKLISRVFRMEYGILKNELETPAYFREKLIANYLYKGPVLEWYMRIKTRLENNYAVFDKLVPKQGKIVDLGCGYGFLSYMLQFLSRDREILGVDYDEDKIALAENNFSRSEKLSFLAADITQCEFPEADVFILADVLHYFPEDAQKKVLGKCFSKLRTGGLLIIRDGDKDQKKRHKATQLTEYFSVKLLKFNKSRHKLSFISGKELEVFCKERNCNLEIIDQTNITSNCLFLIRPHANPTLVNETI